MSTSRWRRSEQILALLDALAVDCPTPGDLKASESDWMPGKKMEENN